ncbi:MAG TPA: gluconate 2-dehydrogenase subunit 3 family protein [Bryobacteraceae bacterium]|nr:gluconate 2-dehydrogenase subunit 3 family protein [Bryobacteraceae bacterium]
MSDKSGVSRRDIFQIIGAAPAIAAVAGSPAQAAAAAAVTYKRQTFDDRQWKTVRVLCDLIIPADERSGSATQAGVAEFLDDWIAFRTEQEGNQNLRAEILGGIMWLDRESRKLFEKDFADASAQQQKQILDRIAYPERASKDDHPGASFFSQLRSLVVGGFFSSKAGVADLPYLGNVAVAEWKGCDPKVWAIIEDRMKNGYKGILEAKPWSA